jgi:ATP-dependent Clp protease ATP-binding subunit ClpC
MNTCTLSKDVQRVVEAAQRFAERHHHDELDSSHLFYILVQQAKVVKDWVRAAGYQDINKFLQGLEQSLHEWNASSGDYLEPSAVYLRVMHKAQQMAEDASVPQITAAHLLAAILELDTRLVEWLGQQGVALSENTIPVATPLLDQLGRDLTRLAREGDLSPVVGRDAEVQQLVEVLLRHGKNSALLLGAAGVGKTAIIERLAQDIVSRRVPTKLRKTRLVELSLTALIAGTTYRGQFEERTQTLLRELKQADNIILVIDEFHTIMSTGQTREGGSDAANILKPALARGELTCIGITTRGEYTRYIEKDAALVRRFHLITISEPSIEETLQILRVLVPRYEQYHHITIKESALEAIVKWSNRYLPSRRFPDKAIDVLGKVSSRTEIRGIPKVTSDLVADVISEMAGVPVGTLSTNVRQSLADLEEELGRRVIGQDEAVAVLGSAIRLSYTGLRDPRRPMGVFLFVGPSGVGKTELARSLAKVLFGSTDALIRLDMSEYSEKFNISRLIGAAPGYVGHEEPGQLTQPLRDHPHSVVLLDEIEKAHPEALDLFLQLFDEGRLTDSHGRVADGRNAIFVMTSNLVTTSRPQCSLGFGTPSAVSDASMDDTAIVEFFRPEFLNRVDHIIQFLSLRLDDLVEIADLELQRLSRRLSEQNIRLTYEAGVLEIIAEQALTQEGGARNIRRGIEEAISMPISDMLISNKDQTKQWIHLQVYDNHIQMEWV